MAKFEGTQSIPAEWLDLYRGTLNPHPTGGVAKKRYPFRLPHMQEGGKGVSQAQVTQRERFKTAQANFRNLSSGERARWYAAEPPWSSFLWYYNYFIMSSLMGNANINEGGAGLIKSIQTVLVSIPAGTGEGSQSLTTIDPDKSVVMLNGASLAIDEEAGPVFWASIVFPYVSSLTASQIKCKWSVPVPYSEDTKAAVISATVIEYI